MLDPLRERMAWRAALRAVHTRRPIALSGHLHDRRLLAVLPEGDEAQRDAWQLIRALDLPPAQVLPVALAGPLTTVPDAYAGAARVLGPEALDWRRLPARAAAGLWSWLPDVAVDFSVAFRLASAYLVGASPAPLRAGYFTAGAEPFFDLLYAPEPAAERPAAGLRHYLQAMTPPLLPFKSHAWAAPEARGLDAKVADLGPPEPRRGSGRSRGEG
jgi:hypothetical protein